MATVLEELLIALRVDDGNLKAELARIVDQARKTGTEGEKAFKPFESGLKRTAAEVRAGLKPLSEYRDELKKQDAELTKLARSQNQNSGEYRRTLEELANVKRELVSVNGELATHQTWFDKIGNRLTTFGGVLSAGVTAPLTILGATGVRSAMQLEVFQRSLETLVGDADEAKEVFEELYEFDTKTTFSWPSLTKATTLLAAFNTEGKDLIPTLGRLGDVSAGVQMDIAELADTYGRMKVSGRVTMLELNQLMGRGIPIVQELSKNMDVSEAAIKGLASTGKLSFKDIEKAFVTMTSEGGRFHDMMQSQTDTTQGRVMALRKEFEQVTDQVGDALLPTLDGLVDRARKAVQWFVDLDEDTQKLVINTGLFAAALGPLLIGLGQAVRVAGQLRTAFVALRAAGLLAMGPTGWIVLGVTAVGALALAFSGRGDSLDKSLEKARQALSGSDKESLKGALDEVIGKVDGDVRAVFKDLRDDLVKTGDTGVEQMQRIARAVEYASELIKAQRELAEAQARLAEAQTVAQTFAATGKAVTPDGDTVFDIEREERALAERLSAMGETEVVKALRFDQRGYAGLAGGSQGLDNLALLPDVVASLIGEHNRRLQELSTAVADVTTAVSAEQADVDEKQRTVNSWLTKINGPEVKSPPPAGDPPPGVPDVEEIQKRVAALKGELAALTKEVDLGLADSGTLAERKLQAVDAAIRDLIRLGASDDVLDMLLGDRTGFENEVKERAKLIAPIMRAEQFDLKLQAERDATDQLAREAHAAAAAAAQQRARDDEELRRQQQISAPILQTQQLLRFGQSERWNAPGALDAMTQQAMLQSGLRFSPSIDTSGLWGRFQSYLEDELDRELARFQSADLTTTNEDRRVRDERRATIAAEEAEAARQSAITTRTQEQFYLHQNWRWSAPGALDMMTQQAARQGGGAVPLAMPSPFAAIDEESTAFVNKVRGDLASAMGFAAQKAALLGDAYDLPREQLRLMQAAIEQLVEEGKLDFSNPTVQLLAEQFRDYGQALAEADENEKNAAERLKTFQDAMAFAKDTLGEMPGPLEQNIDLLKQYRADLDMNEEGAAALATELDRLIAGLERMKSIEDSGLRKFAGDLRTLSSIVPGLGGVFARSSADVAEGLHKIAETDDKLEGTAMVIRGVATAIEGIADAAQDGGLNGKQVLELIGGIASVAGEAIGTLTGIPGLGQVVAASFQLITAVVGDLGDGLAEVREQVEETAKSTPLLARETLDAFGREYTRRVSRGGIAGSFGATKAELDQEAFDAAVDLAGTFATTLATALSAEDYVKSADLGFKNLIRDQLIEAFILTPEVQAQIKAMVDFWKEAWEDGNLTDAERERWEALKRGLIASGEATREQLRELGLLDEEQTKKTRTGGARITDLTGPARDHFADLLAPLRHLGAQLTELQGIRGLLDARLPAWNGPVQAPRGSGNINIDKVVIEGAGVKDARSLFDELSRVAERLKRGR